ncbi:hypothetical protein GGF46_003937 [Coemansia sp. RSA 552]|nr:hypothetical protein GGF46_003937 [Coemansia sp. RSA 552]
MPSYSIFTVDAFATKPFAGNQAAIVPVPSGKPLSDHTMQALAAEMNLSETAYLVPVDYTGDDEFRRASRFGLRWFTPTTEIKLCGHATLAAAHVLIRELGNQSAELRFDTLSGVLSVCEGADSKLEMTFPVDAPEPVDDNDDFKLLAASVFGAWSPQMEIGLSPSLRYLVIHDPACTHEQINALQPNITHDVYAAGTRQRIHGILATGKAEHRDFSSRVFAPWVGVDEDPVTGSAHTVLAPFWQERLGKTEFTAEQCSKRRGDLDVKLVGNSRVVIGGSAVVVIRGSLEL